MAIGNIGGPVGTIPYARLPSLSLKRISFPTELEYTIAIEFVRRHLGVHCPNPAGLGSSENVRIFPINQSGGSSAPLLSLEVKQSRIGLPWDSMYVRTCIGSARVRSHRTNPYYGDGASSVADGDGFSHNRFRQN